MRCAVLHAVWGPHREAARRAVAALPRRCSEGEPGAGEDECELGECTGADPLADYERAREDEEDGSEIAARGGASYPASAMRW